MFFTLVRNGSRKHFGTAIQNAPQERKADLPAGKSFLLYNKNRPEKIGTVFCYTKNIPKHRMYRCTAF